MSFSVAAAPAFSHAFRNASEVVFLLWFFQNFSGRIACQFAIKVSSTTQNTTYYEQKYY